MSSEKTSNRGRKRIYATDEERRAAQRKHQREYRARVKKKLIKQSY